MTFLIPSNYWDSHITSIMAFSQAIPQSPTVKGDTVHPQLKERDFQAQGRSL
jgi:hypothetical protein